MRCRSLSFVFSSCVIHLASREADWQLFKDFFSDFDVIIFFGQARPQSEGRRHTDPGIKLPPVFEKRDESVTSAVAVQVPGIAREATGASRTSVGRTQHMILCAPEQ